MEIFEFGSVHLELLSCFIEESVFLTFEYFEHLVVELTKSLVAFSDEGKSITNRLSDLLLSVTSVFLNLFGVVN